MRAELLTVGSELTSGVTVNTNAAYLSRCLAELGITCQRHTTVGDERRILHEAVQETLSRCDLLITTGGLGPTFDDITMATVAEATQRPLVYQPTVAATIRRFYRRRHRALQRAALRQAYLPQDGVPLPNPIGTAPGLWLALGARWIVALPGVPSEMRAIMKQEVIPRLKRLGGSRVIESRILRTAGIVELQIEETLKKIRIPDSVEVGLYPHLRLVDVRLTARAPTRHTAIRSLAPIERTLRRALGLTVYGSGEDTLESVVGNLLLKQRKTLAVAESCTGGLILDELTNVPGSSRYLRGGVVAYHNDLKKISLGVPAASLARFGAVSDAVAKEMANGVRYLTGADVGLAVTGIAGPTGASPTKPVGLVYISVSDRGGTKSVRKQFFGDRLSIKAQAAQTALNRLRLHLLHRW